ncbi:MAG: DUF3482 domain-containing protein, partial [Gammaproteobacteria bacterium]
ALRQRRLLAALEGRGHAAVIAISIDTPNEKAWQRGRLPEILDKARAHPEWSALDRARASDDPQRRLAIVHLASEVSIN